MTGESLGQVASQTLDNLAATNAAVDMQIFRPLIGSDKLEIIADAQKLGTFEISSNPAPDCCTLFMPRSPETHAKIADVEAAEEALPWQEWIEEIMENLELHEYRCPSSYRVRDEIRAAEQAQSSSRVADVDAAVSQGTVLLG